jgi:hypothetical protein
MASRTDSHNRMFQRLGRGLYWCSGTRMFKSQDLSWQCNKFDIWWNRAAENEGERFWRVLISITVAVCTAPNLALRSTLPPQRRPKPSTSGTATHLPFMATSNPPRTLPNRLSHRNGCTAPATPNSYPKNARTVFEP